MAINRGSIVGHEMKLYWDSASSPSSPTWVLVDRCKDLSVTNAKAQADVSRRASSWLLTAGGLKDLGLEFGYQYWQRKPTGQDTVYDALLSSFLVDTPMHFLVVDNVVPAPAGQTTRGLELWVVVFDFGNDQPLSDGVVLNVVAKPTDVYDDTTLLAPKEYEETTAPS